MRGSLRIHDPSTVIKCNGRYYVFGTHGGIYSKSSADKQCWVSGPSVFDTQPSWTTSYTSSLDGFWAPDVIHLGDRYLLYYSVSSFGKNRSAIGLVTNPTLDPTDPKFQWIDQGIVVQSTNTDNFNTIDPAVSQDADGNLWLTFGSFWGGIKIIQLDPNTGKPMAASSPMHSLALNDAIEASYIHRHDGYYYLFVNWGRCCLGTNSTYEVRVGRSKKIIGPYLDKDGTDLMTGGGSPFLKTDGSFIGPGQVGILSEGGTNWLSCHFYDGNRGGMPTLAILPLRWDAHGWPEVKMPPAK